MLTSNWHPARLPSDEKERLAELGSLRILDTPPEAAFDRLTRMAARHFKMPVALVSLLDSNRQWFKSHYGLEVTETPRDLAFCSHAILGDNVMVVTNAAEDPRFAGNPLVMGKPNIRFYAGAPLITRNGYKLGTVCIIDHTPHPEFSEAQQQELTEIAALVIDEMELRLSAQRAKRDLATVQAAQKATEKAQKKAQVITQEKMEFVATISHELRTPMNGILGMAYLLADTQLDATQRGFIETINHSAQNLLLLINDVLDLSKIEAGELLLENRVFDIRNSFEQTIKLLEPLANKKSISLRHSIEESVPEKITGDPGRFTQIVTNLVGNSVKFTERGYVETILRYDSAKGEIYCSVADTGIGIPSSKRSKIFDKFTQGDAEITQKYGGTGLGLAITKHLVVMLGGMIDYESEENVGSRFWFIMPVGVPKTNSQQHSQKVASLPASGRIDSRKAHVLIAEDHPVNQLFLKAILEKMGFCMIDIAENGLEVMIKLHLNADLDQGLPYDVIFMDCKMPEQDGYHTTRLIRDNEITTQSHIPIVAMTANALAGDREICLEAGMDDYLSKPLQPDRLKEVLERWFSFPVPETEPELSILKTAPTLPPLSFTRLAMIASTEREQADFLTLFFRISRDLTSIMENSRRDGKAQQWGEAAHTLKGSAANLGMTALEDICLHAELEAGSLNYGQRSTLLKNIEEELETIKLYIISQNPALLNVRA